ncbi:acyl-CoA dehydratase activase [Anaerovorax odorimutans]|uniref:acyl-CoA dehydratase activase n=1 Tax=Anaerovorax odorimutans TaxID=109327 RepID=UPI000420AD17|nr:acyl-CoA dehydratase activase [Anaerovorax odorimutans]
MYCIGIDVGSVSTDFVVMDEDYKIVHQIYLKTKGNPIEAIKEGMTQLRRRFYKEQIKAVGTTGSGRSLAAAIVGADIVKNEITTHGVAASTLNPKVRTILEIGGQDSKIILLRDGVISDFAMNTVCAAGTGSFLDRQAERLGLKVDELGQYALKGKNPVRIAGRCAVFAESDIIHKQQLGCKIEDIIAGMSEALVRNYLSNVAKGKELEETVFFQGGVASNEGIVSAFEKELGCKVIVPEYHKVMGAFGAAILAKDLIERENKKTSFVGFEAGNYNVITESFECSDCSNHCEVVLLKSGSRQIGAFSDRCGKYQIEKINDSNDSLES